MAVVANKGVYIVAAKRTPFGKFGGLLRDTAPDDMFATAAKDAFKAGGVSPDVVDTVNYGQICSVYPSPLSARHAALKSGVPQRVPVLNMNKLSGSAFNAVILSTQEILTGAAHITLAGGAENLSNTPYLVRNVRFGSNLGQKNILEDMLMAGNFDTYCNLSVAETADVTAKMFEFTRKEMDEYALKSQMRWKAAHESGVFQTELSPVIVKVKNKDVIMMRDENPRPDLTMEKLSRLPPLFENSDITAGNICGINDGAGAVILASDEGLKQHKLTPLARVVGWACVGVEPIHIGIGCVPAVNKLLAATGLKLSNMDIIEIHETYSAQLLACLQELGLDQNVVNVNGGGLAIGHPSAASGARITAHITHELRRRGLKRAIEAVCIGGGQGIAIILEAV